MKDKLVSFLNKMSRFEMRKNHFEFIFTIFDWGIGITIGYIPDAYDEWACTIWIGPMLFHFF